MEKRRSYLKQMLLAFALMLSTGTVTACEFCHGRLMCEPVLRLPGLGFRIAQSFDIVESDAGV